MPPFGLQRAARNLSRSLEVEIHRLRFNVAVMHMVRALVARGAYEFDYVPALEPGSRRVSRATIGGRCVSQMMEQMKMLERLLHAIVARSSPLLCLFTASEKGDHTSSVETAELALRGMFQLHRAATR